MTLTTVSTALPCYFIDFIETTSVRPTVSEIGLLSIKEWRDLETGCRDCSRSLKTALFDEPHSTFYWSAIVNIALSCTVFELFAVE